jgi:hypothetical protein
MNRSTEGIRAGWDDPVPPMVPGVMAHRKYLYEEDHFAIHHRSPGWGGHLMAMFYMDDDKLASIPDSDRLAAVGLWAMAAGWAHAQRTGGYVPASLLPIWEAPASLAQVLVDARLWAPISGDESGYLFVDFRVRD